MSEHDNNRPEWDNIKDQVNEESEAIPVIEERIKVSKKTVETGKVRVHKTVSEEEVTVEVPIEHEEVEITRIPVNQYVDDDTPSVRHEGETMIIPILKEVIVKRLMLVEEVHVSKKKYHTTASEKVNLHKEEVSIEKIKTERTDRSTEK